jgi:hypothetical protein
VKTDDRARAELHHGLDEALGHDRADTLMGYLPPVGWADVATKHDLDQLRVSIDRRFEAVDLRFDAIDPRFEALESKLEGRFERSLRITVVALVMAMFGSVGLAVGLTQLLSGGTP